VSSGSAIRKPFSNPPAEYQSFGLISPKSLRLTTQAVPESCCDRTR
jgi:hypothetical protein